MSNDKMPHGKKGGVDLAYIDDLTSLYNRRYLNLTLSKELSRIKKANKKLSLFMMDCDNLKGINDTYGHLNGDRVLVEISNILRQEIGRAGTLIRYAGDEFTVVLPEKTLKESRKIADRLLLHTSEHKTQLKDGKKLSKITLSIGIAVYPDDAGESEELIDKADQALYSSKRTGKNKVSTVQDLVAEVYDRDLVINSLPCKKFINREKELELLKSGYDSVKKGTKKFTLLTGGDGIGKTRLMRDFFNSTKEYPAFLLKCRRENLQQRYGAISDALNSFLDFIDAREVLDILASLKDINKFALASTVNKIEKLPVPYSKKHTPSIKELHEQDIFSAFTNFIKGLKIKMMPVLADDVLWIDKGSLEVIRWMLQEAATTGVFVVGTLSKNALKTQIAQKAPFVEFLSSEGIRQILETIDLEPLTEEAVGELLKAVFLGPLIPPKVEKKIFQMSWGYPSNIEEIIKYMIDKEIVYPKQGKWVLDDKCVDKIPASLKDLLDKRIAGLDGESKEVLSKAAILGNDFDVDLLKSFYGKNEGQLLDVLDKLRDKGIFQESPTSGAAALSFVNNIIKENVYHAFNREESQQLHRKVAELLEGSEISRVYGKLRHHLKEAGETDKLKSFTDQFDLAPYAKAAIAEEEVEPSIEEIIEAPLSEKSEKIAPETITHIRAAWVNSQLYPRDNKTRMDSIENLEKCIRRICENDPTLTVLASGENIVLNGRLVDRKKINIMVTRALALLFSDYGIEGMTFKRGLDKKELEEFFSFFSEKEDYIEEAGGLSKLLKRKKITNIKINEISYKKASDFDARWRKATDLFEKMMPVSKAMSNLFSVGEEGLAINAEMLSDPKKAIDSVLNATMDISKQEISEDNKSFMILEGLHKTMTEIAKKDATVWEQNKKRLGELFLSLDPLLRSKIIKDSGHYGADAGNCVVDILSGLDKKGIAKILDEGQLKAKMPPEELSEFLKVILKSQYPKNLSYEEALDLIKKAGMDDESAVKIMDGVATKSFFDDVANELIEGEKPGAWERKSIDNLRPLTEALIIKDDRKTIEKLIESLLARMKTSDPSLRISVSEGVGKVLEVLIEKEIFDISSTIGDELSKCLRQEENINVYIEFLKILEMMINALIQKQNLSLLIVPLAALKEEVILPGQRPVEFRSYAEGTLNRITSPKNMELLLFSFRKKTEADYSAIIDLLAQLGTKVLAPLMKLLSTKDDAKLDPFDIYMRKQYIALIMKKIGEEAVLKLKDLLRDKRPFVVKNIVEVFGYIKDKKYLPYIEQATKHPDGEVRKEAANALKRVKEGH